MTFNGYNWMKSILYKFQVLKRAAHSSFMTSFYFCNLDQFYFKNMQVLPFSFGDLGDADLVVTFSFDTDLV